MSWRVLSDEERDREIARQRADPLASGLVNKGDIVEIREQGGTKTFLTAEDLAVEKEFQRREKADKPFRMSMENHNDRTYRQCSDQVDWNQLTDHEKEVVARIGKDQSGWKTGRQLAASFEHSLTEVYGLLMGMGTAFAADGANKTNDLLDKLPEILDGLTAKGVLVEV